MTAVVVLQMGVSWTPSKIIWRLGREIDNPKSIYYWAFKVRIAVKMVE